MDRRKFLQGAALAALAGVPRFARAQDARWGGSKGYPTGWDGGFSLGAEHRVGNYSGGYESMLPHNFIRAGGRPMPLASAPRDDIRWSRSQRTPEEYLDRWPVTALLIARKGEIWHESYRYGRTASMRLTSWSMAKSVTSLLLGICLDRKLIGSLDDTAERYVPELKGTLHGGTTLRNLGNMSSGAEILHDRDNPVLYPAAFLGKTRGGPASIRATVAGWNQRAGEQGRRFNYNELCPLTAGMVIRQVTGKTLSEFMQETIWQPLGAEADATWSTDTERNEFNCIGFAARLRDWARLGMLVAQRGRANGVQVVSERWIEEVTHWTDAERQVQYGALGQRLLSGYKMFMWHARSDGSQVVFNGHHAQRMFVDLPSQTVLVQTAVAHDGDWQQELYSLFESAVAIKEG